MFFLCRTSPRPSGSVPSAPSTSLFAETSLGVSLPGSSSSSSSLPLGGQGKRGGGLGLHLVLLGYFLPSRSTLVWRGGADVPLGICLSRAGSLLLLLLLRGVGTRELALLLRTPFPAPSLLTLPNSHRTFHNVRIRGSLQSLAPAFYPPASPALRSVARGWIRGLGHVRLALVDVALALALSPLTVRGYGVVSVGGGHRPRPAFLVVAHAVGGRGLLTATALSVEALGRVVPGLDPRIDIGHAVTALGVGGRGLLTATAPALSVRVPMPVGGCGAVVRDRPLSRIARVTARGQRAFTCFSCPLAVRGSRTTGQTWAPGGCGGLCLSTSCGLERRRASFLFWRGVYCRSPVCFLRELAKFFMGLSGSYSLGATGVLAGVTASAAASGGVACPSSPAAGAATFLCCDCDACWGWRFCLLLPLLVLACLVTSGVRACPALAGVAVGRLVLGPMVVLSALQRRVSFFCVLFASSGEALSLFHRFVCG